MDKLSNFFGKIGDKAGAAASGAAAFQRMAEMQKQFLRKKESLEVSGEGGAGMVKVKLNGNYHCISVSIDEALLQSGKKKVVLEDLLKAAVNDATSKISTAEKELQMEMAKGALADLAGSMGGLAVKDSPLK